MTGFYILRLGFKTELQPHFLWLRSIGDEPKILEEVKNRSNAILSKCALWHAATWHVYACDFSRDMMTVLFRQTKPRNAVRACALTLIIFELKQYDGKESFLACIFKVLFLYRPD